MLTRRIFLRRTLQAGAALTIAGGSVIGYGVWEAAQIQIDRQTIAVPRLPPAFVGKTIAVLTDLHHGAYVTLDFIHRAVALANELKPDLVVLLGDYANHGRNTHVELPPCLAALSALRAPLGVYAVPGNHDMQHEGRMYRTSIAATPLTDLTNRAVAVSSGGQQLWLAGVDDYWWGRPNLDLALAAVPSAAAVLLLCHNPDFTEDYPDARVSLALCGHTHGGQIYIPGYGPPRIPSRYGMKYRCGLVQGPASLVFVSCGLGLAELPLRFGVPPEINLITLAAAG